MGNIDWNPVHSPLFGVVDAGLTAIYPPAGIALGVAGNAINASSKPAPAGSYAPAPGLPAPIPAPPSAPPSLFNSATSFFETNGVIKWANVSIAIGGLLLAWYFIRRRR